MRLRRSLLLAVVVLGVAALAFGGWAAVHTGRRLPWDGFALWAVALLHPIRGVWFAAYDGIIRSIGTRHGDIAQHSYRTDVITHLFAVPLLLAIGIGILAMASRRGREGRP